MIHASSLTTRTAVVVALLFALTSAAHAGTLYVANNGVDGAGCGAQASPCRSITRAIVTAVAGDTIIVGPGRYGDLDNDGLLGDPGEEVGIDDCPPGTFCGICCAIRVTKAVIILSSHGAASTVIDARSANVRQNVLLNAGEFGRPGKGFSVTNTKGYPQHIAIEIDGANVTVRGNQIVASRPLFTTELFYPAAGISAIGGGPILIEGNQVMGSWEHGIHASSPGLTGVVTVRKNQVSSFGSSGITAGGDAVVVGNILTGYVRGIVLEGGAKAVGNTVSVAGVGIMVHNDGPFSVPFTGVITRNNLVGNGDGNCGVYNDDVPVLNATNNYWGAATGPGPDPADQACNTEGATTVTTPFAPVPFIVKAPIKP